jgi:hypothetical protein
MTLLRKIDTVFEWLYLNSGSNPDFKSLQLGIYNACIEKGEIRDILLKLKADNFIYCELGGNLEAPYTDESRYLVNFNGKFFWETTGGYETKAIADATADRIANSREKYLSVGTVVLAILTGLLVLVETLEHWREILSLFSSGKK